MTFASESNGIKYYFESEGVNRPYAQRWCFSVNASKISLRHHFGSSINAVMPSICVDVDCSALLETLNIIDCL